MGRCGTGQSARRRHWVGLSRLLECRMVYRVKNLIAGVIHYSNLNKLPNGLVPEAGTEKLKLESGLVSSRTLKFLGQGEVAGIDTGKEKGPMRTQ
jgi:hypothetical protein